jgi:cyclopropane fatty-acyl-phospholipid synthase-like methyltransferase
MNHDSVEYAQYKAQRIKELIPSCNQKQIKIIDFGCSDGTLTFYLQEVFFNATIIGVDRSALAIAHAQKNYPSILFETIKGNQLEIASESVDAVIASDVFHHISFIEQEQWIKEIHRILKRKGLFVMTELNPSNKAIQKDFKKNPFEKDAHLLSCSQARKMLDDYFGDISAFHQSIILPFLSFFMFLEPYLWWLPWGQWYILLSRKK